MTQYHSETKDKKAKGKKEYNVYYMLVNIVDDCYNRGPLIT